MGERFDQSCAIPSIGDDVELKELSVELSQVTDPLVIPLREIRFVIQERSVDIEGTWDGVEEVDYDDDDIVESDDDFPF